jgi:hypothetical protein
MIDEPVRVPAIRIYAGDTVVFPAYRFRDGTGALIDLSQWTITASWRRTHSASVAIPLDVDDTDAATGMIRVTASADATETMRAKGVWDLQAEYNGIVKTLVYGVTEYILDVTR